ncbi:MAG: bifunctional folylpolyglutamate synthase/dihydrofolate synthase [Rhodospirillales bacterium]|nr:bifunctional folylpolyglutamate synthase/dihydrofolate synthase [Rhodospirillales bacterium]
MYAADALHPNSDLQKKLNAIYRLRSNVVAKVDLSIRIPYMALLEKLGNPHINLPPVIHVAGTNGKGSTIATLRACLETQGYKVHVYTSPHLVRFNERIILAGKEISDGAMEALLDEVMEKNDDAPLTFFEITTALALTAFARSPADILLLEVGMGGRLDCTNVIDKPLATIITRISRDHTEFLGDTLTDIALEKAGIMKPDVPCIIGPQDSPDVMNALENHAKTVPCPLIRSGSEWRCTQDHDAKTGLIRFSFGTKELILPQPCLIGPHQFDNTGMALACLHSIADLPVSDEALKQAMTRICWPGRLQQIMDAPIPDLPDGWELWLDGGHNDSAGQILGHQARIWQQQDNKKLHIIMGMMKNKDPEAFVTPILPYAASITCIPINGEPAGSSPEDLKKRIEKSAPCPVQTAGSLNEALSLRTKYTTLPEDNSAGRVLVTGSLYLVGSLLNDLYHRAGG